MVKELQLECSRQRAILELIWIVVCASVGCNGVEVEIHSFVIEHAACHDRNHQTIDDTSSTVILIIMRHVCL